MGPQTQHILILMPDIKVAIACAGYPHIIQYLQVHLNKLITNIIIFNSKYLTVHLSIFGTWVLILPHHVSDSFQGPVLYFKYGSQAKRTQKPPLNRIYFCQQHQPNFQVQVCIPLLLPSPPLSPGFVVDIQNYTVFITKFIIKILMNIRLLVVLILIGTALANLSCSSNYVLPNIESGSINFVANSNSSNIINLNFQHAFRTTYNQPPSVALTLQSFSLNSVFVSEWELKVANVGLNSMNVLFTHKPNQWSSVSSRFLAARRPDLIVGAISQEFNSLKLNTAPVFINFPSGIANWNGSIARAFISGWKIKSGNQSFIRVFDKSITANQLQLAVQVAGTMQITSARINYILFNPSKSVFASYGGFITENNFVKSKVYNFQKFIHLSNYSFYGLSSIRQNNSTSVAFDSFMTEDFYTKIESSSVIQQFLFTYLIIGVGSNSVCGNCDQKLIFNNLCTSTCPQNSYLVSYVDGGKGCRQCPSNLNMIINGQKNGCQQATSNVVTKSIINSDKLVYGKNVQSSQSSSQNLNLISSSASNTQIGSVNMRPLVNSNNNLNILPIRQNVVQTPSSSSLPLRIQTQIITPAPTPAPSPIPTPSSTNQSQAPSTPVQSQPAAVVQNMPLPTVQNCAVVPNTYWNGYKCACSSGYTEGPNGCMVSQKNNPSFRPAEFLHKISSFYNKSKNQNVNINTCREFQIFNGQACICIQGYSRNEYGICTNPISLICPPNSVLNFNLCVCLPNFQMVNNVCVPKRLICDQFSYDNGLGVCVCKVGYASQGGRCVPVITCPPYSSPDSNGNCVCDRGYQKFDGRSCSQCPAGQVSVNGRCIFICGVNQVSNPTTRRCECIAGFGRYNNICTTCPQNFFLSAGYCVTCPLYSQYNTQTNACVCRDGLTLIGGVCRNRCPQPNQVFSSQLNRCVCFEGLARVNGVCQVCTNGFVDPSTQQCRNRCGTNEVLQGSTCVCARNFGRISTGQCVNCATVGGFQSSGICVICPGNQIFTNGRCGCPPGKRQQGLQCVDACRPGQLVDAQGGCYFCPINQVANNGRCQCRSGFVRIGQLCQIQCPDNQIVINGACGVCVLGTVYDQQTRQCICPPGYFTNNNGVCELVIPTCPAGTYQQSGNCLPCSSGCAECISSTICTRCVNNAFSPFAGSCGPRCGDGIQTPNEGCDDGNANNNDGCSNNCFIQPGFICSGNRPSFCSRIPVSVCGNGVLQANEQCQDGNNFPRDGCFNCQVEFGWTCNPICKRIPPTPVPPTPVPPTPTPTNNCLSLSGPISYSPDSIFLVLVTSQAFPNLTEKQKRQFITYQFPEKSISPNYVYCAQTDGMYRFQCKLMFAAGIPNRVFNIQFGYNYQGDSCLYQVTANPLSNMFPTRSMRVRN